MSRWSHQWRAGEEEVFQSYPTYLSASLRGGRAGESIAAEGVDVADGDQTAESTAISQMVPCILSVRLRPGGKETLARHCSLHLATWPSSALLSLLREHAAGRTCLDRMYVVMMVVAGEVGEGESPTRTRWRNL